MDKILVVDRDVARARKMLEAFDEISECYHLIYDNIDEELQLVNTKNKPANDVQLSEAKFHLALVHARDKEDLSKIHSYQHRVWYGGYGAHDQDAEKWEMIIRRSIVKDGNGALNKEEAQELLDYLDDQTSQLPAFLFFPNQLQEHCLEVCGYLYGMHHLGHLEKFDEGFKAEEVAPRWEAFKKEIRQLEIQKEKIEFLDEDYTRLIEAFKETIFTSHNTII